MIFIVVKFDVAHRYREDWISMTKEITAATRAEPGNLWFEWPQTVEIPTEFVLVEAFRDQEAGLNMSSRGTFATVSLRCGRR